MTIIGSKRSTKSVTMQSWWHNASREQRLAQLDGGIECGMVGREIAVASGLGPDGANVVLHFAADHGRKFAVTGRKRGGAGARRRGDVGRARRAYLAGESVDFWNSELVEVE